MAKQVRIHCCAIRSAVANSSVGKLLLLSLSHLSLLFRMDYLVPRVSSKESVNLLGSDIVSSGSEIIQSTEVTKSCMYEGQLRDLMVFDGSSASCSQMLDQKGEENRERDFHGIGRIDDMIKTNVLHFAGVAKDANLVDGSSLASSGLVKRR